MDTDDENKGEDDENREEPVDNPKKKYRRMKEDYIPLEGKIDAGLEISVLPTSPIDRCMAWENLNARTSNMGIVREFMNPKILEEK